MTISSNLQSRSNNCCELCSSPEDLTNYTVSPKSNDNDDHQVVLCGLCNENINTSTFSDMNHWRCLTGSIWSEVPVVQVLTYRILSQLQAEDWAQDTLENAYLDESLIDWAMDEEKAKANQVIHKDGYGNILQAGDNVILIENLNVKGTSYIAPKGTMVRKIRLVHDNAEQVEGKNQWRYYCDTY